ncbi:MAG: site-specific integrase [Verrucomicrobia bacterium]|nr:MAG: site-specific integrase [Verrucomicrobiota bacterium]
MQSTAQFSKSKVQCLLRHRGGNYYASAKVGGKLIRRSLDTDDYNVAKLRLPPVLAELRGAKNRAEAGSLGAAVKAEAHREDPAIKPTTRHYYQQVAVSLAKISAKLPVDPLGLSITRVTLAELRALMDKYAAATSPTRYNGCLALLRRTYARAMESGHVGSNLPAALKRVRPLKMKHDLPTAESFAKIVADILAQRKSHSKATAMAVELLAYTGLRISEAQSLQWRDIKADHLVVRTAKNDDLRQVPLIPAALELLTRLRAAGVPTGADDPVMLIKSPRIALDGSCERLGIDHMRVHDLRHLFATRCIESGVDLPTLATWLGHKDGGVLAAQVYGHLCRKHSTAMAGRVKA